MTRPIENAERVDVDSNLVKAVFRLLVELNEIEQRHNAETDRRNGDTSSQE